MLTLPAAVALVSNEFWDYEEQVDLEAFSSSTFYDILLKHSVSVTIRLGQLRGEVRLYENNSLFPAPMSFKYHPRKVQIYLPILNNITEVLSCN